MSGDNLREKGVIYYATGQKYLEEAKESAKSLKEHNNLHVTVFTDIEGIKSDFFDNIEKIDAGKHPFYDRINYFEKSPYQKTLHLDTDTYIAGDITPIFEMLDRFDIVARIDPFRDTASEDWGTTAIQIDAPDSFPEYQCGVIGFADNPKVGKVFDYWQERYAKFRDTDLLDQPLFREAIYNTRVDIGTLPSEYNVLTNNIGYIQSEGKIFHFNGERPLDIYLPFLSKRKKADIIEKLNSGAPKRRVHWQNVFNFTRVKVEPRGNLIIYLIRAISKYGLIETLKRALSRLRGSN